MDIKIRLLRLSKRQKDLLGPLRAMGFCVTKDVLSRVINGKRFCPDLLIAIQKVLAEWEAVKPASEEVLKCGDRI